MSDFVTEQNLTPTPSGGDTSAPAAPTVATPQFTPSPATPGAPPVGATPNTPPEGFVPSYRLREAREAAVRQTQEQLQGQHRSELASVRAELDRYRQQIGALTGVSQQQANPQVDQIRQQLYELEPWMPNMAKHAESIPQMFEKIQALEQVVNHVWGNHARTVTDRIYSKAAESLGGPLTSEGKDSLRTAFIGWLQADPNRAARYETDPSIADDFWQSISSTLIDPVRRSATATVVGRAPGGLPQDTPGGAPRSSPAPQFTSLDDRVAAGWNQYKSNQ